MVRLKLWQWVILATPIAFIITFLLVSAGLQIHEWRINWIWAVFTLFFVGWRILLVKWTQPQVTQIEAVVTQVNQELKSVAENTTTIDKTEAILEEILNAAQSDRPI